MTLALAIVALVLAVVVGAFLVAGWASTAQRLARAEHRIASLEREVRDHLAPDVERSVRRSEDAAVAAREARLAVGIEDPPPRLAGERVTGPLVRTVAVAAGARRVVGRFVTDLAPGGARRQRRRGERAEAAKRPGRSGRSGRNG